MAYYFLRKLTLTLPTLIGVTLITFVLFHIVGGDPALIHAGKNASPEIIENIRSELGMNRTLPRQYLFFLQQVITFDWGESWSYHQPITDLILQGIGPSLSITVPAFTCSVLIALLLALGTTIFRFSWFSRLILSTSLGLMSVSFIVYIILLQKFLAFDLNLFPIYGWNPNWIERWSYVTLPCLIYVGVTIGPKIFLFRTALLQDVESDYVRTARAKGMSQWTIYGKHILKNSLIPIVSLIVSQMPTLITGSLLLETFFGIPGVGHLLIHAIQNSDFPMIKAMTVLGTLVYLFFNFINDLIYYWIDPRIELK